MRRMERSIAFGESMPTLSHALTSPGDYMSLASDSLMFGSAKAAGSAQGFSAPAAVYESIKFFVDNLPGSDNANEMRANPPQRSLWDLAGGN